MEYIPYNQVGELRIALMLWIDITEATKVNIETLVANFLHDCDLLTDFGTMTCYEGGVLSVFVNHPVCEQHVTYRPN
jgi:hypothetical protein